MTKQQLMEALIIRYEDNAIAGKSAKTAGVAYSTATKLFTLKFGKDEHDLPAKFLADHPQGGDVLEQNIKAWIRG